MEVLAYAHSYESYEREVGIDLALPEYLWNWRGVPSAFGLHLLAIAALVILVGTPDFASANPKSPTPSDELLDASPPEAPPRLEELRDELRQLSQQKFDYFSEGTNAANAAAELAKTAKTEAEWDDVAKFWQQAIAAMQSVPPDDANYALARTKISEYQANLNAPTQPSPEVAPSPQVPVTQQPEAVESPQVPVTQQPEAVESPQAPEVVQSPQVPVVQKPEAVESPQTPEVAPSPQVPVAQQPEAVESPQAPEVVQSPQVPEAVESPQAPEVVQSPQLPVVQKPEAVESPQAPEVVQSPQAPVVQQPEAVESPQTPEVAPSPQAPVVQQPEAVESPQTPVAQPENPEVAPTQNDFFNEGTNAAAAAAKLGQLAQSDGEWNNVAKFWQQAIAAMQSVPEGDANYALAREKIREYQANLKAVPISLQKPSEPPVARQSSPAPAIVQSPPQIPQPTPQIPVIEPPAANDFFNEGMNASAAAAKLGQLAQSDEEWNNVEKFWQQAIAAMKSVPEGDANYALARANIPEYEANLNAARQKISAAPPPAPKPSEPLVTRQPSPAPAPVQSPPQNPQPTPETPAIQPPLGDDFFYEGTNAANAAAELGKLAKTEQEWKNVEKFWQQAIAAMQSVPEGDRDYALAREKIREYEANLDTVRQRRTAATPPAEQPPVAQALPADFFYEGVNAAATAAQLAQTAKTAADWDKVEQAWNKAIAAMQSVPEGDRDYALAREKRQEYESALAYARRMPDDFSKGIQAASQAVELGKAAKSQSQWQSVAQTWQRAISAMKSVAPNHPQFAIASQKIIEYEYYLDSLREKLQTAISPMTLKKTIRGNLSPKSIVYSGRGRFFVQNMMYGHTISVYNQQYELVKTLSDTVRLADFGHKDYPGSYRGAPVEAAFSHGGQYAWVSNYQMYGSGFGNPGSDRCNPSSKHDPSFLYRINADTLNIQEVIKVGSVPKYVAATPDNRYILASNWCSWDLSIVDSQKNQEIRRIALGAYPRGIAVDSNSLKAYVAVMGSSNIAVVNLQNFAVDWIKNVGAGPRHLNLSPDNRYLYASLNSEGTIAKIDLATNQWQKARTGNAPRSSVLSADGQFLYVVNYFSNSVSKVRTSDLKVLQTLPTDPHPIGITYDPDTQQVWVVCYSGSIMVFQD